MALLSQIIEDEQMINISCEFKRLSGKCYLDNAGAAQYPESILKLIQEDLSTNLYMNPHSDKSTSDCIDQIRNTILNHFNTDSSKYTVVFTSGTTQSLKLVLESFQFNDGETHQKCGTFMYLQDNHTSVLGLRELAEDKNANVTYLKTSQFLKALNVKKVVPCWEETFTNKQNSLFAYPAQSNFNGCKYPIDCCNKIKNGCLNRCIKKHEGKINNNWYVLVDAASFVSTNKLDLFKNEPDFVCLSFYKIFGFPTGLGALLIKNESANVLSQKKYFGGGTVDVVISGENFHIKRQQLNERFEDGTLTFLSIIALRHCFQTLYNLIPKAVNNDIMDTISHHTFYLAKDLYNQLNSLHHPNEKRAVMIYNNTDYQDINKQGAIVTFNLLRDDGSYIGYSEFQHMADLFDIHVRTGCFCNSGSCQKHLKITNEEIKEMYKAGHTCGDEVDILFGKPTGCVRVSFGYYNTFKDVDKLISMISKCFVRVDIPAPQRIHTELKVSGLQPFQNFHNTHKILSNISSKIESSTLTNKMKDKVTLTEIAIYPIKSCGAFKIRSAWRICSKGFEYDREWMIIKDNGVCLTQKNNTKMCLIRPKVDFKNRLLTLHFKGRDPISIPLEIIHSDQKLINLCKSKVCTDTVQGYDCGDDVANWISEALEVSFLRLIRQSSSDQRSLKMKNISDELKMLSLSNQAQYLLINKATVRWLKNKIHDDNFTDNLEKLTDRFRGNMIIDTEEELVEREWQRIIIGKHEFKVESLCSRCQMVCIDQCTGEKTVEPLRTISEQFNGKIKFGIYLSYNGAVDGSADVTLKTNSNVTCIRSDGDISRVRQLFLKYFNKYVFYPLNNILN